METSGRIASRLNAIEARKDITLAKLVVTLVRDYGASFAPSLGHRFLARHRIMPSKSAHAAEQDRPDVTLRGRRGSTRSLTSTRCVWCSSTRPVDVLSKIGTIFR